MKENFEIHNYEFFKEDTLIYVYDQEHKKILGYLLNDIKSIQQIKDAIENMSNSDIYDWLYRNINDTKNMIMNYGI